MCTFYELSNTLPRLQSVVDWRMFYLDIKDRTTKYKKVQGSTAFLTSVCISANLGSAASVKTNPATFCLFEAMPALLHSFSGFLKVYKYSRVHQSGVDHVSCKSSASDGIQTAGLTEAREPARLALVAQVKNELGSC